MSTPDAPAGLSTQEALQRLRAHGPNQLDDAEHRGLLSTLRHIDSEPMFMLMLAAAGIYLVLGDLGEGALLAFFALVTLGLVVFQKRRSERALDALRTLSAPSVRVRRQGIEQRIASRDLVPGDVLLVSEGERVAADGRLLQATHLAVDESLLTGESVPVSKGVATTDNTVHAGTLVVAGHALVAPEEFPMALTVFLALGAWRLAKVKVLAHAVGRTPCGQQRRARGHLRPVPPGPRRAGPAPGLRECPGRPGLAGAGRGASRVPPNAAR